MANLTQQEFAQAVELMAEDFGLQRLRDQFVRLNALVTRRRVASAQKLAEQLYMLTGGLRRQVPATIAFQSLWAERVNEKIGEDAEKELEKLAEKINSCLGERDAVVEEKSGELNEAVRVYEGRLVAMIGPERARIDMLLKAVPAVATMLRAMPPGEPIAAPAADAGDDKEGAAEK